MSNLEIVVDASSAKPLTVLDFIKRAAKDFVEDGGAIGPFFYCDDYNGQNFSRVSSFFSVSGNFIVLAFPAYDDMRHYYNSVSRNLSDDAGIVGVRVRINPGSEFEIVVFFSEDGNCTPVGCK